MQDALKATPNPTADAIEQARETILREMIAVVGMEAAAEALNLVTDSRLEIANFIEHHVRKDNLDAFLRLHDILVDQVYLFERRFREQANQTALKQLQVETQLPRAAKQRAQLKKEQDKFEADRQISLDLLTQLLLRREELLKDRIRYRDANLEVQRKNAAVQTQEQGLEKIVRPHNEKLKQLRAERKKLEEDLRILQVALESYGSR